MRVVIVDDDPEKIEQTRRSVLERWPGARVCGAADILHANGLPGSWDLLIVDVSSHTPVPLWHFAFGPICSFLSRHPGCAVIIDSACAGLRDIVQDILDRVPGANVRAVDWARLGLEDLLDRMMEAHPCGGQR